MWELFLFPKDLRFLQVVNTYNSDVPDKHIDKYYYYIEFVKLIFCLFINM